MRYALSVLSLIPFFAVMLAQGPGQNPQTGPRSQTRPPVADASPVVPAIEIAPSVTHHTLTLPSGAVTYTATAAQIPLRNEAGEVECRMFYVAYTKDGAEAHNRPVTFAFNGGPGSATLWLHMGSLGPKRAPMNDDGTLPNPPYEAVDNMDSWLDFTDVVVIDAPGTGYSRIARPDLASKYFGLQPDIAAFSSFIRNWLTSHKRWRSPLFVAGESYGGIRGSGLSNALFRSGVALNGFVSISGTSNFMTLDGMRGNDSTYISFFPSMAACAWYHHKLAPRFKDVASVVRETQDWIDKEYAPALQRGDSLSPKEKEHIADKMSEYLGISKKYCLGANLRVTERQMFRELLRDEGLTIGRYDGRLTGKEELLVGERGSGDPSDDATTAPFTSSLNDYLQNDLAIKTDLPYLNSGNVRPWAEPEGSYAETASDLRSVLARNQHFRALYCCGYYDLACPLNGTIYTVNHMGLDPVTRSHVSFQYYPAGHMMYIEKSSRKKLHDDVAKFEADCLSGR
ncbi:Carboxypeptidase-related protein [Fimbriimonas ginsengisoli Gsoil 348]|uniref:Carboxypeptidase-related protein n=1 Tax=Fimbriimonas ginsengisoli Gsoil 348 TaxID=661478 RepID=A0A068NSH4_FIMGI|nr:Carboxypeptidase-related protein [Fimbriimonas ginsengisoli Gsoil 348]